jgi:hypothetical protein
LQYAKGSQTGNALAPQRHPLMILGRLLWCRNPEVIGQSENRSRVRCPDVNLQICRIATFPVDALNASLALKKGSNPRFAFAKGNGGNRYLPLSHQSQVRSPCPLRGRFDAEFFHVVTNCPRGAVTHPVGCFSQTSARRHRVQEVSSELGAGCRRSVHFLYPTSTFISDSNSCIE